ncbi:MAG: serine/threonine protein phosphatase [Alphaproteobacteria bacterium]|nr:serine/threonine protein phosphatase [Alphaproteobacteria bacterium]
MGNTIPAPAWLPPGRRVYAIGDVHGCLGRLVALHARIAADLAERPVERPLIVHVGDYVDRGPDSAGVVRHLLQGFSGVEVVNLMGNHEHMMLDALDVADPGAFDHWMRNGGRASLRSWEVPNGAAQDGLREMIPAEHLRFLRRLALHHREGGYLFVHAGIRPGVPIEDQSSLDLMWIREPFLSWTGDHGAVVVHGHTPMEGPVVKSNRIGIDTGAVLGGPLTCAVLELDRVEFLFA